MLHTTGVTSSLPAACLPVPSSLPAACLPVPSSLQAACLTVPSSLPAACLPVSRDVQHGVRAVNVTICGDEGRPCRRDGESVVSHVHEMEKGDNVVSDGQEMNGYEDDAIARDEMREMMPV